MTADLNILQQRIIQWAESCPDLRALLVVGSQARRGRPADEWSDLDLMLLFRNPNPYLANQDWIRSLGPVLVLLPHETGEGDPEFLVLFEGGYKVDFVVYTADYLQEIVRTQHVPSVYLPGFIILVDKDGLAAQLPLPPGTPPAMDKPSSQDFVRNVETFWYGALYVAKQIRRGNLWVVKYRDWTMKEIMLTMLTWHTRATQGWDLETWHDGHAMAEWTDPQTWGELQHVFGQFSAADSWRALIATMDLFKRLAKEVAAAEEYSYPQAVDVKISNLIENLRAEDQQDV